MPGLSNSNLSAMPGAAARCSGPASAGSNSGDIMTLSGGKVTTKKLEQPGPGNRLAPGTAMGSLPSNDSDGVPAIIQMGAQTKPGVCFRAVSRGETPSLTTTDFPEAFLAVTTRLKLMFSSSIRRYGGAAAAAARGQLGIDHEVRESAAPVGNARKGLVHFGQRMALCLQDGKIHRSGGHQVGHLLAFGGGEPNGTVEAL